MLVKKFSKYSVKQIQSKIESGKLSTEEVDACNQILVKRGVLEPESATAEPEAAQESQKEVVLTEEEIQSKRDKVGEILDKFVSDKEEKLYEEAIKSLGGKMEDDVDDIIEAATIENLEKVISIVPVKKAPKAKTAKAKAPKAEKKAGENVTIEAFTESGIKAEEAVSFEIGEEKMTGTVKRVYIDGKSGKEKARIVAKNKKIYFKLDSGIKRVEKK